MHSLRVLIVEDNPADEVLLRSILMSTGLPVLPSFATTVDEAEDTLATHTFSLVLSDVNLEGMRNGFDLWSHCQSEHPFVPFVITSGIGFEEWNKLSAPGEIAPLHFEKPYRAKEIRQSLCYLLKR